MLLWNITYCFNRFGITKNCFFLFISSIVIRLLLQFKMYVGIKYKLYRTLQVSYFIPFFGIWYKLELLVYAINLIIYIYVNNLSLIVGGSLVQWWNLNRLKFRFD